MCIVTKHARKRIRERLCVPQKKIQSYVDRAFDKGLRHGDTIGNLHGYVDGLYLRYKKANNIRVYRNTVFIFESKTLITVLQLPKNLIDELREGEHIEK